LAEGSAQHASNTQSLMKLARGLTFLLLSVLVTAGCVDGTLQKRGAPPSSFILPALDHDRRCYLDIREQWEKLVSCDFVDAPHEVITATLTSAISLNLFYDPAVLTGDEGSHDFRATNEPLSSVLDRWMRSVGQVYTVRHYMLLITTRDRYQRNETLRAARKKYLDHAIRDKEKEALRRRATYDAFDTPLAEVLRALSQETGVGIVWGPAAATERTPLVDLRMRDMELEAWLDLLVYFTDLDYTFREGKVYVSTRREIASLRRVRK